MASIQDVSSETDVGILQQAVRLLEHENARLVKELGKLIQEIAELRGQDGEYVQLRLAALERKPLRGCLIATASRSAILRDDAERRGQRCDRSREVHRRAARPTRSGSREPAVAPSYAG
jgi:hypothetical protein